ncbi:RecE family exodeoxyribonuclease [Enterobacter ludwigii]|uniref:RecE family exodeoxyribonuclease n=1 Tax=Enterobacter ludwigii TaxID=299767 RepID=UPI002A815CE1|nr:RecE family exodeoxyribonuclease [Enterobacter ludwigii]
MSTKPLFLIRKAKKSSGEPDAVLWACCDFESACATLDYLIVKSGRQLKNYFKAVATNFPVVDDLPPEGEIDFTWCDRYHLADDRMTWQAVPGAPLPAATEEKKENETGSVAANDSDLQIGEHDDENTRYPVLRMGFRKRLLSQLTSDQIRHHLTRDEFRDIAALEMDTDNGYVQNVILVGEHYKEIRDCDTKDLWRYTDAIRKVFDKDKRHELALMLQFTEAWLGTEYIDRGVLVKEWQKGNRISRITGTSAETTTNDRSVRQHKQTWNTLDLELAIAFWPGDVAPGNVDGSVLRWAKSEIIGKDREDWKRFSASMRKQPDALIYDPETILGLVRNRPEDIHKDPVALNEYISEYLTTHGVQEKALHTKNPATSHTLTADEKGTVNDEEETQSAGSVADEQTTPETVEPDTAKHHQDTQPLDAQPQLSPVELEYQKKRAELHEAIANIPPKNPVDVDKQLAAQRGEYVEGISDPNDPKWLSGNNSNVVVNDGEKPEETVMQQTDTDSLPADNEDTASEAVQPSWPSWFEPGRYEGIPNEVYHSANGISSTMLKDARISLMYYHGRHIAGTIPREESDALLRGRIIHSYVLETDKFNDEYAVPAAIPDYVVTTSQDLIAIIKEYNAALPALMTPEQLREWIESYNGTLTQPLSLGASAEETGTLYGSLPEEFKRIPAAEKHTASAMKACIKEYNATLPPLLKTSGTREQLLDQIATVDPTLAENERAKFQPYNISGTKEQLTEIVRAIRPEVVTLEDWQKHQATANRGKTLITVDMYEQAKNIHEAVQICPDAARLLNHPERKSEISYFGFDEETGLEIRVRPDIEIRLPYESICADLKSVSLGYVRQERLKDRLHREIIERDYHLSAAMYCDVANLDKFFWIFVNKDAGYHWVAVVEASQELLELGRKEYRRTLRQINEALETNRWPAPITESYTDELNDFDLRRLEALSI